MRVFKLRRYSWCLILSAMTTIIRCVMPARIKSACKVFSFCVRLPARQRFPLYDECLFLHQSVFYTYCPIPAYHGECRDKSGNPFQDKRMPFGRMVNRYRAAHIDIAVFVSLWQDLLSISLLGRRIYIGPAHSSGRQFPLGALGEKNPWDNTECHCRLLYNHHFWAGSVI